MATEKQNEEWRRTARCRLHNHGLQVIKAIYDREGVEATARLACGDLRQIAISDENVQYIRNSK